MSPLGIQILLHCYYSPSPLPLDYFPNSIAKTEIIGQFLHFGVIRLGADREVYATTEKGNAWVAKIVDVPIPIKKITWVDPREENI